MKHRKDSVAGHSQCSHGHVSFTKSQSPYHSPSHSCYHSPKSASRQRSKPRPLGAWSTLHPARASHGAAWGGGGEGGPALVLPIVPFRGPRSSGGAWWVAVGGPGPSTDTQRRPSPARAGNTAEVHSLYRGDVDIALNWGCSQTHSYDSVQVGNKVYRL